MEWKTLKELNAQPGDVVEYRDITHPYTVVAENYLKRTDGTGEVFAYNSSWGTIKSWKIVKKADEWGPWQIAAKPMSFPYGSQEVKLPDGSWCYREKLGPVTKEINLYYGATDIRPNTHVIKFNTIDGVPDVSSIKMEAVFKEKTHD